MDAIATDPNIILGERRELLGPLTVGARADMLIIDGDPWPISLIPPEFGTCSSMAAGTKSRTARPYCDPSVATGSVALTMTAHTCCRRRK